MKEIWGKELNDQIHKLEHSILNIDMNWSRSKETGKTFLIFYNTICHIDRLLCAIISLPNVREIIIKK